MFSYNERKYKRELEEANTKLRKVKNELDSQTAMLNLIVEKINTACDDEVLTVNDFMYYFAQAIESDEETFTDQFTTLIMTAKIFFGEELHKIRVGERKTAEFQHKMVVEEQEKREKRREDYQRLVEKRDVEKTKSIAHRKNLMKKIFVQHSVLDDLSDDDRIHAEALLESGHLKESFWFKRLMVIKEEEVPPEKDKEYYEGRDHPGCPYTGGYGFEFYI